MYFHLYSKFRNVIISYINLPQCGDPLIKYEEDGVLAIHAEVRTASETIT